jgi:tetratricopeptide (TPR) repeat protein
VSEESERVISGPEGNGAGVDPTAVALALAGASREKADAFLDKQSALIDDQRRLAIEQHHHLHEQFKSLRLTIWEKRAGVLLRVATAFVGMAVAGFLGAVLWNAAHSDGLIVESFTVPPDLAARGITGQVVASRLLDKLTDLQAATTAVRAAKSYANNWGDDLRVEIPDTGVSIGEVWRFLRGWLGHETHISGEVTRTDNGIAVTARSSGQSGATYSGPASDLDGLVEKAAEHAYSVTQPFRYGWFLRTHDRIAEGKAVYDELTHDSDITELSWALHGLAVIAYGNGKFHDAESYDSKALALYNASPVIYYTLTREAMRAGHAESGLKNALTALRLAAQRTDPAVNPEAVPDMLIAVGIPPTLLTGDFKQLEALSHEAFRGLLPALTPQSQALDQIRALAGQHDGAAVRLALKALPPPQAATDKYVAMGEDRMILQPQADVALEDWRAISASEPAMEKAFSEANPGVDASETFAAVFHPILALAKAKLGDIAGAEAAIAITPADCYDCVRIRGLIATEARQWGRADYWFARAVHDAPSIPFAYEDWGRSLLARGQPDAAIAKFRLANQKGPHFADPLEGWGEALMAKNQSHLALAKFAEAEKYAPNWGRLHLKWGEALVYVGKRDDARAQFTRAAGLDLTPSEKAELEKAGRNSLSQH